MLDLSQFVSVEATPFEGYQKQELLALMQLPHVSIFVASYWIASEGGKHDVGEDAIRAACKRLCLEVARGAIEVVGTNIDGAALKTLPKECLAAFNIDEQKIKIYSLSDENYLFDSVFDVSWRLELLPSGGNESADSLLNPSDLQNEWKGLSVKQSDVIERFGAHVKVSARRGAPPKADWAAIKALVQAKIKKCGFPDEESDPGWQRKADVERYVIDCLTDRNESVSESVVRTHVTRILGELLSEAGK